MPASGEDISARMLRATTEAIASEGVRGVTLEDVCEAAGVAAELGRSHFDGIDALLLETTRMLCDIPVFPEVSPAPRLDSYLVLSELARAHRQYVDEQPTRFLALLQLAPTAVLERSELRVPLASRNRRARQAVSAHLWPLRTHGAISPERDVARAASLFVDIVTGIEMCFALDGDARTRSEAYEEGCVLVATRLTGGA